MPDLTRRLTIIITTIAQQRPITAVRIRAEIASHNLRIWSDQRTAKTIIRLAKEFRAQGKLGRVRATLLIAAAQFGSSALAQLERSGILLTDDRPPGKFGEFGGKAFQERCRNRALHHRASRRFAH